MRPLGAALVALALTAAPRPPALSAQAVAIVGGDVHTVSGPVIRGGTVVIQDGRIAAVGADLQVPAGARVIDAAGKVVTPGLMDSETQLGVVEIGLAPGTVDASSSDRRITAAFNVADGINPRSTLFPVTRVEGITRAVVAPTGGATLISGRGVLVDLGGDRLSEILHRDPVAMYASLGESGAGRAGGARGAALLQLREALQDARDYARNRQAFESGNRRPYALSRLDLEALVPVVNRELPLVLRVHRASDVEAALRFAREEEVRVILSGVLEGWMVADEIAAAGVPVVVNPMTNLPGMESMGATLENAARLHRAGVTVILTSFDTHNARNLKQVAGNAVSYGMPHEAALRAVTLTPAEVWGVADRYGSLEPGKEADVVVWSGDPFELATTAEHVFIRGREVPPDTRPRELFRRYRDVGRLPPE